MNNNTYFTHSSHSSSHPQHLMRKPKYWACPNFGLFGEYSQPTINMLAVQHMLIKQCRNYLPHSQTIISQHLKRNLFGSPKRSEIEKKKHRLTVYQEFDNFYERHWVPLRVVFMLFFAYGMTRIYQDKRDGRFEGVIILFVYF
jgi:hypothetical protein